MQDAYELPQIKIGGIVFGFRSHRPEDAHSFESSYRLFFSNEQPDVILDIHYGDIPDIQGWTKVFDTGSIWSLWQHDRQWAIQLSSPVFEPPIYQVAILDSGFDRGAVFCSQERREHTPFPFDSIFAQVLMVNLLAKGKGVLVHACAVKDGDAGRLFLGNSGAGKSTMARLWSGQAGVSVLCDDRVILRKQGDRYWMYSTPWHGDFRPVSADILPLERVFILRHAEQNQAIALKPAQAVARLAARAFPPFWDAPGMAFSLDFLADLALALPCYELGFRPDIAIVDYVRGLKEA